MSERLIVKRYINHLGLDLKSTDLVRKSEYASVINNAQYRKNGSIESRPGGQIFSPSGPSFGMYVYDRKNPINGVEQPECLGISTTLEKLNETKLTVSYSGVDLTAIMSIFYDTATSVFRAQIQEGVNIVLDMSLGLGVDETTPVTVSDLDTAISAITGFAATTTGDGNVPAAFLMVTRDADLAAGSKDFTAKYWSAVNTTNATPFAGTNTNKNEDSFELPTSVQLNNVIYFSNGYDFVQKYDGQTCYRAGLPNPTAPTVAAVAGAVPAGTYQHKIQYVQVDAVGNIIESNDSTVTTTTPGGASNFNIDVPYISSTTGFNTNCAIVAGAQVGVTVITVDDGAGGANTMKAGDTAYFYDAISASYVEREVTARSATTITIAGAAVTVADNAVISNNLRVKILRTKNAGTLFYEVVQIPNNSFSVVITPDYVDSTLDANLTILFTELVSVGAHTAPPKGKYLSKFRNQILIAGDLTSRNTLYWSDIDSPEYFPIIGTNQDDIQTTSGSVISGIAENNEVFCIFQNPGIHVLSGDLANGNIRIDQVANDVGCISHHSIQEVRGVLYFLSDVGPRKMVGGQLPQPLGVADDETQGRSSRVDTLMRVEGTDETTFPVLKRAIAVNHKQAEKYLLYIPCESTESGSVYANDNSFVLAYDYTRDAWLQWTGMNMSGGTTVFENQLLWKEHRYSTFSSAVKYYLHRQMGLGDVYDYADHSEAIPFRYSPQWEFLTEPSLLKRFLRLKVFSIEETANNSPTIDVTTDINFIPDSAHSSFTLDFTASGYGTSAYGTDPYGGAFESSVKYKLLGGRVRAIRVNFTNNSIHQNPIITGWELLVAAPYRRELKP